jgi:hypothetical protein
MRRAEILKGAWYDKDRLVQAAEEQFALPKQLPGYFKDSAIRRPWAIESTGARSTEHRKSGGLTAHRALCFVRCALQLVSSATPLMSRSISDSVV